MIPSKLVSFLLPSRGRPERLMLSLDSLEQNCADLCHYEVLVRADADDVATHRAVEARRDPRVTLTVGVRGQGYLDLHLMVNQVAAMARGEFLVLWNDDALMLTKGWDDVIHQHLSDSPKVYKCRSAGNRNKNIFPIVRRSIYDAMGRFSECALNDFYMSTIAQRCGIEAPIDIDVKHDHPAAGGTIIDQTYLEAAQACGIVKHCVRDKDSRVLVCLAEDEAKVRALLSR